MNSFPREGLNKAVIERFLLRQNESGGGLDYSAPLQILNDLTTMRNYASQMSMVDDGVGQVMDTLEAQGLRDNTIVIYTTDHGFSIGHHGYWGHGQVTLPSSAHASAYLFSDELFDLKADPAECINVITQNGEVVQQLDERLTSFFNTHSSSAYDLWQGGTAKSNSDKPWLWQGAWGAEWTPVF